MLKEIKLSNFRLFNNEVVIRVRPITVLIGKNNAGKSSIIKFLLMLQQSLDTTAAQFIESEGERVHMGSFSDLKNSKSKKRSLEFQLRFEISDLPSPREREILQAAGSVKPRIDPITRRSEFKLILGPVPPASKVKKQKATFKVSAGVNYSWTGQRGVQGVVASLKDEILLKRSSPVGATSRFLRFPPKTDEPQSVFEAFITGRYIAPLRYEIRSYRHLSAIREESQRAIVVSSPPRYNVGQRGQFAMPHLQQIIKGGGEKAAFVRKHIDSVAGIQRIRFVSSMKGYLAHCMAINKDTGAEVFLADFGFGVSQCIPIFVQGVLLPPNHMLMVEQPEAQLHPTAQIEMGSFFSELWTQHKVMSLIETHSSNIILRLRRLVAKGDLQPEDISIAFIDIKDKEPEIKNLDIQPDGSMEKGLPIQFFGADVFESMKLGAKK